MIAQYKPAHTYTTNDTDWHSKPHRECMIFVIGQPEVAWYFISESVYSKLSCGILRVTEMWQFNVTMHPLLSLLLQRTTGNEWFLWLINLRLRDTSSASIVSESAYSKLSCGIPQVTEVWWFNISYYGLFDYFSKLDRQSSCCKLCGHIIAHPKTLKYYYLWPSTACTEDRCSSSLTSPISQLKTVMTTSSPSTMVLPMYTLTVTTCSNAFQALQSCFLGFGIPLIVCTVSLTIQWYLQFQTPAVSDSSIQPLSFPQTVAVNVGSNYNVGNNVLAPTPTLEQLSKLKISTITPISNTISIKLLCPTTVIPADWGG